MSELKHVYVNDGDDIVVVVRLSGPTVADPSYIYKGVAKAYRVVAHGATKPLLELTPLMEPELMTETREGASGKPGSARSGTGAEGE